MRTTQATQGATALQTSGKTVGTFGKQQEEDKLERVRETNVYLDIGWHTDVCKYVFEMFN